MTYIGRTWRISIIVLSLHTAQLSAAASRDQLSISSAQLSSEYTYTGQNNPTFKQVLKASPIEVMINKKYYQICELELGRIPVEKISCDAALPIPMQRTEQDGSVTKLTYQNTPASVPRFGGGEGQLNFDKHGYASMTSCDKPSAIFRDMKNVGCVPGDRIKYLSNVMENGDQVDWVYICRKNNKFMDDPHLYNELGMIGYNRDTGKTCFFAGQPTLEFEVTGEWQRKVLSSNQKDNAITEVITETKALLPLITGKNIPPPNYTDFDPRAVNHWSLPIGGCIDCHSQGPFIRFPFTEPIISCTTSATGKICDKSFDSIAQCNIARDKLSRKERLKTSCETPIPKRQPGMLYAPISPFEQGSELAEYITNLEVAQPLNKNKQKICFEKNKNYLEELMCNEWNHPMRLMDEEAKPCTMCHAIGNSAYGDRFAHAAFILGYLKPDDSYHIRSKIYLSNVSASKRSEGFHDQKVKTEGLLPIRFSGDSIEMENDDREEESIKRYLTAINKVKACSKPDNDCSWDEHWTIKRVKQQPLKYLQDHCSYCHTNNMAHPRLVDAADFKNDKNKERVITRLFEPVNPMPPSGQFPDNVKAILVDYLRKN